MVAATMLAAKTMINQRTAIRLKPKIKNVKTANPAANIKMQTTTTGLAIAGVIIAVQNTKLLHATIALAIANMNAIQIAIMATTTGAADASSNTTAFHKSSPIGELFLCPVINAVSGTAVPMLTYLLYSARSNLSIYCYF